MFDGASSFKIGFISSAFSRLGTQSFNKLIHAFLRCLQISLFTTLTTLVGKTLLAYFIESNENCFRSFFTDHKIEIK